MNKKSVINFAISISTQLILFLFAFLVPKIIIQNLGSEANGYISTVEQLFIYISLVEAGIGNACLNALYKPISVNDDNSISSILSATKKSYKKVALFYFLTSTILAAVLPLVVHSSMSYLTLFLIVFLRGLGGTIVFFFESTVRQLLIADGRHFYKELIHVICYGVSSAIEIALIIITKNPLMVEIAYVVSALIGLVLYYFLFKKKYKNISLKAKPDYNAINDKKYFLIHQISGAVFSGTDLLVISIFCGLNEASIYSLYALVFSAISSICTSVMTSLQFNIGQSLSDKEKAKSTFDKFNSLYIAFTSALFTVTFLMVNGFMGLYTSGADVFYVDKFLPTLLLISNFLSFVRQPSLAITAASGNAKNNVWQTILEAVINLVVSLVAVNFLGVYGVVLGTIAALLFRSNQVIIFANKKVLNRSSFKTYLCIAMNIVLIVAFALFGSTYITTFNSFFGFLKMGIALSISAIIVFISFSKIFDKNKK